MRERGGKKGEHDQNNQHGANRRNYLGVQIEPANDYPSIRGLVRTNAKSTPFADPTRDDT